MSPLPFRVRSGVCAIAVSAALATASAQSARQPRPTFSSSVDIVSVDVNVIDRHGQPVGDLLPRDFPLEAEGRERAIVSAQFVPIATGERAAAGASAGDEYATNAAGDPGRLIAIVVDRGSIAPIRARDVFEAAARFVDHLPPADRVGLFTIPTGPQIDFTTRHRGIVSALLQSDGQQMTIPASRYVIGTAEAVEMQRGNGIVADDVLLRECGTPGANVRDATGMSEVAQCRRGVEEQASVVATYAHERARNTLAGLRGIIAHLGSSETPKTIVLISQGLVIDNERLAVNGIGRLLASAHATLYALEPELPDADPSQPRAPQDQARERAVRETGLETMTQLGGGELLRVIADPDASFERLASELSGYYLLGFEPAPGDRDGRSHTIHVDVRREDVDVRSRAEFTVAPPVTGDPEHAIAGLLRSPASSTQVPFTLTTYAFQDPASTRIRLLVAVQVDPAEAHGHLAIGIAALKADGETAATFYQPSIDAGLDAHGRAEPFFANLLVDPGAYTLKAAIVDGSGRTGSLERSVRAYMTRIARFRATELLIGDDEGRSAAPGSIVPTVTGRMSGDHLHAYLELFGDDPKAFDDASVTLEIVPDGGTTVVNRATAILQPAGNDPRVRSAAGEVSLTLLPAGRYWARAVISVGGRVVGHMVRAFRIVKRGTQ